MRLVRWTKGSSPAQMMLHSHYTSASDPVQPTATRQRGAPPTPLCAFLRRRCPLTTRQMRRGNKEELRETRENKWVKMSACFSFAFDWRRLSNCESFESGGIRINSLNIYTRVYISNKNKIVLLENKKKGLKYIQI